MQTDAELVAAYAARRDEAAFAEIARRHGDMVYRACLRMLGEPHDAEDASQAVFVVLARRARALRRELNLAAWLHGVARNVSLRAVQARSRRLRREREAAMISPARAGEGRDAPERRLALTRLDRELGALPAVQRQAVMLRYLEGRSQEEAAAIAGCPRGTLSKRASRGLEMLRQRLGGRGAVLSSAGLAGLLQAEAGAAAPQALFPSLLAASKLAATGAATGAAGGTVLALAEGAMKAMFWMKIKVTAALIGAAAVLGAGVPVTVQVISAAEVREGQPGPGEETKPLGESERRPPPGPAGDEALSFRRLRFNPRQIGLQYSAPTQVARRGMDDMLSLPWRLLAPGGAFTREQMREMAKRWIDRAGIDFKKEMVLAAFKGPSSGSSRLTVQKITVARAAEVRVEVKFVQGKTRDLGHPYDMVVCPRRDLPVVFYENGKKIAEVLPLRRIPWGVSTAEAPKDPVFHVCRDPEAQKKLPGRRSALAARAGAPRAQEPDYPREMLLAAFRGMTGSYMQHDYRIAQVTVSGQEVRVDCTWYCWQKTRGMAWCPVACGACPRRDLPVVFYENGREVARVALAKAEDKGLAGFLEKVGCARVAGIGVARSDSAVNRRSERGEVLAVDWDRCTLLYGNLDELGGRKDLAMVLPLAPGQREAGYRKGDKVIFCWEHWHGNPAAVKWTAEREKAVRFALAPGWEWTKNSFRCPWCRGTPCKRTGDPAVCVPLGKCTTCSRKVGPATRGVALGLLDWNPRVKKARPADWRLTVNPGQAPVLWLRVTNDAPGGRVPELTCHNNSLRQCDSLLFIVGESQAVEPVVVFPKPTPRRGTSRPAALTGSPSEMLTLRPRDCAGRPLFRKPGSYTVRAAAGRLISNPVKVFVRKQ